MKTILKSIVFFLAISFGQELMAQTVYKDAIYDSVVKTTHEYTITDGKSLKLDFYTAQQTVNSQRPLLVYVHGGGFAFGNRYSKGIENFANSYAKKGYAVASVSYRLQMKGKGFGCDIPKKEKIQVFEDASEDVSKAINYILKNNNQFNINKEKVVLSGTSAGAEAILHLAYVYDDKILPNDFKYAGIVSYMGALIDDKKITQKTAIPSLLMHGIKDPLVPYNVAAHHYCKKGTKGDLKLYGSRAIADRLKSLGKGYYLYSDEEKGHEIGTGTDDAVVSDFLYNDVVYDAQRQIEKLVKKKPINQQEFFTMIDSDIWFAPHANSSYPFKVGKKFPAVHFRNPEIVKKGLGGSYDLKVRWFDTDLNEVTAPTKVGRYAFYAVAKGKNGKVLRRAATAFCAPNDWAVWAEDISAMPSYMNVNGATQETWENHKTAIADYTGRIVFKSIMLEPESALLLSFLDEVQRHNLVPDAALTPITMDGDYHARLKQKVLEVEGKFTSLKAPEKGKGNAQTLQPLSTREAKKNQKFKAEMDALCNEWAENGEMPFDMLIAKDGKILFHDAFGNDLRGEFSTEKPTELASITKLYSGLLFAQFVDQGIIDADAKVGEFLPNFAKKGDKAITLRQCFVHTNGYEGHGSLGGVQNPWLDNSLAHWTSIGKPGTYHSYNGLGYNLAGKVMEVTQGKSVFRLFQEQLFKPLGLKNTKLDLDLAFSTQSTAYDIAVVAQMLLNKGKYGDVTFFSEKTFNKIMPVKLIDYFPNLNEKQKDMEWGLGIIKMLTKEKDENGKQRAILSDEIYGHGSATSSIFKVDFKNNIVIGQSRMGAGKKYGEYVKKMMLLIEKYHGK